MPALERFAFANLWLSEALLLKQLTAKPSGNAMVRTTAAPTMLHAGIKENVLPTTAEAIINFRLAPGDSADKLQARLAKLLSDLAIKITPTNGILSDPSPAAPVDGEPFKQIQLTIEQVFPDVLVAPGLVLGATDGRYFSQVTPNVFRFSAMRVTGDDLRRFHGKDERLAIDNLLGMIRFYHRLLINTTT
jgi:carboxypeptidase PM20D1